jgi:hypothetical protein
MTPEIGEEWNQNQSSFARRWRRSMVARKKVVVLDRVASEPLRRKVDALAVKEKAREAMMKDIHLIEAALASDLRVASLDEEARGLLTAAAQEIRELKKVVWVNPDKSEEQPIVWLEEGAKAEHDRRLGFTEMEDTGR